MSIAEDLANEGNGLTNLIYHLISLIIHGGSATNDYDLTTLLYKRSVPILMSIGTEKNQIILNKLTNHPFGIPSKLISEIHNLIVEGI